MKNQISKINPNETYSLVYVNQNHNFAQFNISGKELMKHVNQYFIFYTLNDFPLTSDVMLRAKEVTCHYTILWASFQKDKTNFKNQVKGTDPNYVISVEKSFKGNKTHKNTVREHIAIYLYIKLMDRDSSSQNNKPPSCRQSIGNSEVCTYPTVSII